VLVVFIVEDVTMSLGRSCVMLSPRLS